MNPERRSTDAEMVKLDAKIELVESNISNHEKLCAERYKGIHQSIDSVEETIKLIFGRFWKIAMSLTFILLLVIGSLYTSNQSLQNERHHIEATK